MIKIRHTDDDQTAFRTIKAPNGINKYIPHQGNREKLRRLERIYRSHPHDCSCKSCELMDTLLKSRS